MKTEESIRSIFKGETKLTTGQLRHTKRKHATYKAYLTHISFGPTLTALNKTGLLPHFLKFLHDYNWLKGNFCKGRDRIHSEWAISPKTIHKFFLLLYYLEVIEPYGLWKKDRSSGIVETPIWILTDKLFKAKPEAIYKWAEKLHFGMYRLTQ